MKGIGLTHRQKLMLETIRDHIKQYGVPPTRAELAKELEIANQAGVDRFLSALVKKGWVRLLPGIDRGIQLLREGAPILELEDLPKIAAAHPNIIPTEYLEPKRLHDFNTFSELFESRPDFFLRVRGESMHFAGFEPGDIVAMKRGGPPRNGDIVVAQVGDGVRLGRFFRNDENGTIELDPISTDPKRQQIVVDPLNHGFEVRAIVVGAIIGPRR